MMEIQFDNNTGEKYSLDISVEEIDSGDGVVLTLNRKACESFAQLFLQLASVEDGTHVHIGNDHLEPQGPGFRLVRNDNT